mgnify:CR=1 FL=1
MEEKKKSMTKDEMIMELMELLKANGRPKQAADVFESAAYVDMLESKLDQMTSELVQMRKELQEMKEQQASKSLKETLSEMVDRAQARCQQMKEKLFEAKEEMHNKAAEIVKAVKQKGKEALNKVSEFFGVKKKTRHLPALMVLVRGCEWRTNSWQTVSVFLPERSRWIIPRKNMHSQM